MSSRAARSAERQIRRATEALTALAARQGGADLAAQLAGLVAVIAENAAASGQFNAGLIAALAPAASAPAGSSRDLPGQDELETMTKAELLALVKKHRIPHPQVSALSRARKGTLVGIVLQAQGDRARGDRVQPPGTQPVDPVGDDGAPRRRNPASSRRPAARRPSVMDPYAVARSDGEAGLRARLSELEVDQLKDIVGQFGMNYDRRAMRWTTPGRLIDRIVERVEFGTTQGSAFRGTRS